MLPRDTADVMIEMAGFRNVLVHEYDDIQADRVYAHLQDLRRFDDFAADILQVLERQE